MTMTSDEACLIEPCRIRQLNSKNSKHSNEENLDKSYSGIGLTNIKQSLKLLFGNDYLLNIHESDKEFEVQLTIPIYENKLPGH